MRLYKMELYKLCHKKIFVLGMVCIPAFTLLSFFLHMRDAASVPGQLSAEWEHFTETYSIGMIPTSILILCVISPVFAGETHTRVKSLSFTTKEGPCKDAHAKLAASFTVSAGLWLMMSSLTLLPYLTVCGFDALSRIAGPVMGWGTETDFTVLSQPFGVYLTEVLLLSLVAAMQLCAVTLYISARLNNPFHVICASSLFWCSPIFGLLLLHSVYRTLAAGATDSLTYTVFFGISVALYILQCSLYASPLYLVLGDILIEATAMNGHSEMQPLYIMAACACTVLLTCTVRAYRRYRRL